MLFAKWLSAHNQRSGQVKPVCKTMMAPIAFVGQEQEQEQEQAQCEGKSSSFRFSADRLTI